MDKQYWAGIESGKQAVFWNDGHVVHFCEGGEPHPGDFLIWTKCGRDVPPDEAYVVDGNTETVTCRACLLVAAEEHTVPLFPLRLGN